MFCLADNLIPTLNSLQQTLSSRDINSLCQILLNIALEDPGIPNPKKGLTNLGQKLSEIDINEHTFSEILRLYIRERNGFDDKVKEFLDFKIFNLENQEDSIRRYTRLARCFSEIQKKTKAICIAIHCLISWDFR